MLDIFRVLHEEIFLQDFQIPFREDLESGIKTEEIWQTENELLQCQKVYKDSEFKAVEKAVYFNGDSLKSFVEFV